MYAAISCLVSVLVLSGLVSEYFLFRRREDGIRHGAMTDFDHIYKLLFSRKEMVADLLTGFVREDWMARLDLSTLEKLNGSCVSDDLRERHDDIVRRVRFS